MSATATETITQHSAKFKFSDPDLSVTADQRAFYAPAASKEVKWIDLPLYDYRTSDSIVKGPAGIDKHGFTVVKQQSALSGDEFFSEDSIRKTYMPEIQELVKSITGCKNTVVNSVAFRRKKVTLQADDKFYFKKGEALDSLVPKMKHDKAFVIGTKVDDSREPVRLIHCDYTFKGLRNVIRFDRPDMIEAGQEAARAEDKALKDGVPYRGPRYAAFSIWRSIREVRRDPLALLDTQSVDQSDFAVYDYRLPSPCPEGEYRVETMVLMPPKNDGAGLRWYWLPRQQPDEVFVIKLADSDAEYGAAAGGVAHCSPVLAGDDDQEPRESIEVRIVAFW